MEFNWAEKISYSVIGRMYPCMCTIEALIIRSFLEQDCSLV